MCSRGQGRPRGLHLWFHSSFIRVLTVIDYFLEIATYSRLGQIIANYRNASFSNMSATNTNLKNKV